MLERSVAHDDDLEDREEDGRRCHRGWELQHGRNAGSYFGRDDHPVKHIVARAASDSPESHERRGLESMPMCSWAELNCCKEIGRRCH